VLFPTGCTGARSTIHVSTYTFSPVCPTKLSTRCVRVESFCMGHDRLSLLCNRRSDFLHFTVALCSMACYRSFRCDLCQLTKYSFYT